MGAIEHFQAHGVRFELQTGDTIRAIGRLDDPLRADIKLHKASIVRELQWGELESLLAIVAPAYNASENEVVEMHQLARDNIDDALSCYRIMAKQVRSKA